MQPPPTRNGITMTLAAGGAITAREKNALAPDVTSLVRRAAQGDQRAWEGLFEQFSRLVWSITRDFKLMESDAADVAQVTWLRLLEHINRIDQPQRVGSWLATTARNECLRTLAARQKLVLAGEDDAFEDIAAREPDIDEGLLAAERAETVHDALSCLPRHWQQLLQLLMADPPVSYTEISEQLGLPIGSIGPTRARGLARLRKHLQASGAGRPAPKSAVPGATAGLAASQRNAHGPDQQPDIGRQPRPDVPRSRPRPGSLPRVDGGPSSSRPCRAKDSVHA